MIGLAGLTASVGVCDAGAQEEKSELLKEMETLQARLRHLEAQQCASTASPASSELENTLLRESVRSQQLTLAATQGVVSGFLVQYRPTNFFSLLFLRARLQTMCLCLDIER